MGTRNPYAVNGYQSTNAANSNISNRYGDLYSQENPSSGSVSSHASRERRAGGWGGFGDTSLQGDSHNAQPPPSRPRYGSNEDTAWRRRAEPNEPRYGEPSRSRDKAAKPNGFGGMHSQPSRRGGKSMEEVLQYIQSEWKFMGGDECVPVQVALKLMDPSSLGLADKEPQFQQTHMDLQMALRSIVNEHHQDFNSSIGTYHKIQSSIQNSQSRVRYLKTALGDARGGLLTTKPELKGLATSSQSLDDNLQLFSQIESLRAVPETLEARISEKRFLTAVDILQEALRVVRKSEFDDLGAIVDLRTYFANQEQSLTDILVEELHDHLYLKSPYCHERWKTKSANGKEQNARSVTSTSGVNAWDKPVYHYLSDLDPSTPMVEDASRNPEADTFYYIHLITESLSRLGRLDVLVSRIEQRLPVELYKVVDKTNNEVDARHPGHIRSTASRNGIALPTSAGEGQGAVLSDFLWSLYAKFEAIAEGHRVLHEVISSIVDREKLPTPETYTKGFKELWKLYQSEMRSLLHDYLSTDGDLTRRSTLSTSDSGNVFGRNPRNRHKKMFRLTEMDSKSSAMKGEQDDLDDILKSSVPGLVSKSRGTTGINLDSRHAGSDSAAAGHKLVVEPSVFNVNILLPPTLSFLQRLKDIVPINSNIAMSTLTLFLDDFLVNVFHPQLEEAITEYCTKCMMDLEAFSEDPQWQTYSPRPVFKGTIAFISLINAFSRMLSAIPQDQIFTQLVIAQLHTYFDKCYGWYKASVSRLAPSSLNPTASTLALKAAASYAEAGEIRDFAVGLLQDDNPPGDKGQLVSQEIQSLLSATKSKPLHPYDIIADPKSVLSLCLLYNSMQWLSSSLSRLRHVETGASIVSRSRPSSQTQPRRWTLLASLRPSHERSRSAGGSDASATLLPLNSESVIPFDNMLSSFRNLAQTALITLHIDVRLGAIHQLTRSLRGPNAPPLDEPAASAPRDSSALPPTDSGLYHWFLPQPPTSASPLVLDLNGDLIKIDTTTSAYLGPKERAFLNNGLAKLLDRTLIVGADYIQVMNTSGAQRMGLDILVLQQNLRNIAVTSGLGQKAQPTGPSNVHTVADDEEEAVLEQSAQFYNLFLQGPERVMSFVKENKAKEGGVGYTYDELRTLIELCYSAALRSADREENVKAKKGMQDCLLQLGELLWDS
jgi:exocyst complex component 4